MLKLHELKAKYDAIAKQMRSLNDTIADAAWTDEQRSQWKEMKHELDGLKDKIEREEELRDADQRFVDDNSDDLRNNADNEQRGGQSADEQRAQAFDTYLRQGQSDMSAEQRQLLKELRAQGASVAEKGGYTVPTDMLALVHESMKAYGGIASIAHILTTDSGNNIEWGTSDGTAEEGALIGENVAAGEQDVEFGIANLGAKKLTSKVIRVSNELLNDSGINVQAFLASRIASRIGRAESRLLVQGTGAGTPLQPSGLETSVTGTTNAAAAATFKWNEVAKLIHSIDPAYRNAPGFRLAFNDATLLALTEMEDAQGRPLWLPAITGAAPATVLGQQYTIDQAIASQAASAKFMYAGDFQQFIVRRVRYMVLKRLVERYAEYDQTGFLAFHRFDCVLQDTAAIKALVGKPV